MTRDAVQLTLFYREGCHLCESMLRALRGLQPCLGFELQLCDIDGETALAQRYDEWVPVLCLGEREICHYQLDEKALLKALQAPSASGAAPDLPGRSARR